MTKKFDPKQYQGKVRVFRPVPGTVLISRIYYWDRERSEYCDHGNGSRYLARRYEKLSGRRVLKSCRFSSLEEAKDWQTRIGGEPVEKRLTEKVPGPTAATPSKPRSPLFKEVFADWQRRFYPRLSRSTQINYEKSYRLHLQDLLDLPIREFSPRLIDEWLDKRRESTFRFHQSRHRRSFRKELSVLQVILRYYGEYHDDPEYRYPIKARHRQASRLKKPAAGSKDLTVDEFHRFREALEDNALGKILSAMATVQYFQALRISEVAAIHWEDIHFGKEPSNSRIRVCRHVVYLRGRNQVSRIEMGFKNASDSEPVKELPLFPAAYCALECLHEQGAKGLVFKNKHGTFFGYREIQHYYDHAFVRAGLPYRGTHVLRHGGTRHVYNETGDLAVAQQLLGNSNLETTLVYAKRQKNALTKVAAAHWEKHNTTSA